MCEPAINPETGKPRFGVCTEPVLGYKVVSENTPWGGPYHKTRAALWNPVGDEGRHFWAVQIEPTVTVRFDELVTCQGYHVFETYLGAETFFRRTAFGSLSPALTIIPVLYFGRRIAFWHRRYIPGWIVETWRPSTWPETWGEEFPDDQKEKEE